MKLKKDGYLSYTELLCIMDSIYRLLGDVEWPEDEATPELRVNKMLSLWDKVLANNVGS